MCFKHFNSDIRAINRLEWRVLFLFSLVPKVSVSSYSNSQTCICTNLFHFVHLEIPCYIKSTLFSNISGLFSIPFPHKCILSYNYLLVLRHLIPWNVRYSNVSMGHRRVNTENLSKCQRILTQMSEEPLNKEMLVIFFPFYKTVESETGCSAWRDLKHRNESASSCNVDLSCFL